MARKKKQQPSIFNQMVKKFSSARWLPLVLIMGLVGILVFNYFSNFNNDNNDSGGQPQTSSTQSDTQNNTNTTDGSLEKLGVNQEKTHTIVSGESLSLISIQYFGTPYRWQEIAQANNLVDPNTIHAGNVLIIPNGEVAGVKIATASTITGTQYTVQKGDTVWDIAVRAYGDGYQWTKISQANNLENPGIIHVGNVLQIPRDGV